MIVAPPTNIHMFLHRLRNVGPNTAYVVESFEVIAVYISVLNDSAIQAVFEVPIKREGATNMSGLPIQQPWCSTTKQNILWAP